ncbi:MAG: aspartate--tRNA ligase [Candidatus Nanoarchaeia archaeon]|nr:aspartate--tRNA ligase [Candidatus Nanoarchaeia archaeon]
MFPTYYRTNTCGELTEKDLKKKVTLCGWVAARRDHGGIIFIDLRDRYGITQIVFEPENKKIFTEADKLRREFCISISGTIRKRPKGMENKHIKTGEIEILVDKFDLVNPSEVPPFELDSRKEINEDIRLQYRYLDLRRPEIQKNIINRYRITKIVRDYMDKQGFVEVETPMLAKSTPEGSRDYLVPSRIHAGKFYALPQSPQIFKQLLMVSGFDRYFQIVKCFRDEDLRADRQPEFTQIDIEMSFINEKDIQDLSEGMIKDIFKEILDCNIKLPLRRMTFDEAMENYGTDKPDLRYELKLIDVDDIAKKSDFNVFKNTEIVKCLFVDRDIPRNDLDTLVSFAIREGAQGLAWIKVIDGKFEGNLAKFFNEKLQKELIKKTNATKNGALLFIADRKKIANQVLGRLRQHIAKKYNYIKPEWNLLWVTEFPLLEYSDDDQRWVSVHHPFTAPFKEDLKYLDKEPGKVRSHGYDLVLNGVELGGGSIRIHDEETQSTMFKALGISKEEARVKFGFLLDALKFGAPIHGGIAFGLDRLVALLSGNESIREVIAFPKNKAAEDVMSQAPSEVDTKQLKELNLKLDIVKKESKENGK